MVAVAAVDVHELHEYALPRLVARRGVQHPLVAQFAQRDVRLNAEHVRKDARPDNRNDACFSAHAVIQQVVPVPVRAEVVLAPLRRHGLEPARDRDARFSVDALDNVIHLGPEPLVEHIVQRVAHRAASGVLGLLDHLLCGNEHLEVAVVYDCDGICPVAGALDALHGAGEYAPGLERLDEVEHCVPSLVRVRLHTQPVVDGNDRSRPGSALPPPLRARLAQVGIAAFRIHAVFCRRGVAHRFSLADGLIAERIGFSLQLGLTLLRAHIEFIHFTFLLCFGYEKSTPIGVLVGVSCICHVLLFSSCRMSQQE